MFTSENNPGKGRPKGSENKETKKIREWISKYLSDNLERLNEDIDKLKPRERIDAITSLMEYAVPKLARVENLNEESGQIIITVKRAGDSDSPQEPTPSPEANP